MNLFDGCVKTLKEKLEKILHIYFKKQLDLKKKKKSFQIIKLIGKIILS